MVGDSARLLKKAEEKRIIGIKYIFL